MSHVSNRLFQHGGDRVGPILNAVRRDKKSAIVFFFVAGLTQNFQRAGYSWVGSYSVLGKTELVSGRARTTTFRV